MIIDNNEFSTNLHFQFVKKKKKEKRKRKKRKGKILVFPGIKNMEYCQDTYEGSQEPNKHTSTY